VRTANDSFKDTYLREDTNASPELQSLMQNSGKGTVGKTQESRKERHDFMELVVQRPFFVTGTNHPSLRFIEIRLERERLPSPSSDPHPY
jgi:hypothetical protein